MTGKGPLHYIEKDIAGNLGTAWTVEFVREGIRRLEDFLACYAEFERRYGR